ncbi:Alpha/Beta hydrolase protein [Echria macrotheca]|uniref:Alpha/Beta hydrolase protein n=1 Tax=Echria macrotheca TaxID=438768 RepID=A0AAJ0B9A9_9PEZI|nr:Alpha/Beta hydrolase protein [Echria macrotheca]
MDIEPAVLAGNPVPDVEDSQKTGFASMSLWFDVPLNHRRTLPKTETLTLHAKLVYARDSVPDDPHLEGWASDWVHTHWKRILRRRPFLLYLCGGPGDGNNHRRIPELNRFALEQGYQVLYVDYRGTGRSRPFIDSAHLASVGATTSERAAYLSLFRQDNIARDLEAIRLCLSQIISGNPHKQVKWTIMGQSFGGWIALTYLSFLPSSLAAVYLTGGLAPIGRTPHEVYACLYHRVAERNEAYYRAYPDDVDHVRLIASHLHRHPTRYSFRVEGSRGRHRLTAQTFMTLGRSFGGVTTDSTDAHATPAEAFRKLHLLVERMVRDLRDGSEGDNSELGERAFSEETVDEYAALQGRARGAKGGKKSCSGFRLHERPLYGVLHEAIYCHSPAVASAWSAQAVGREYGNGEFAWLDDETDGSGKSQWFDAGGCSGGGATRRLFFSGEMIYPFMLATAGPSVGALGEVADSLARKADWPALYDEQQLAKNKVPVRAIAYPDDMYVDYDLSLETGSKIRNCVVLDGRKGWGHGAIKDADTSADVLRMLFASDASGQGY